MSLEKLRKIGRQVIDSEYTVNTLIPLEFESAVFRQMFEYPVSDFEAEVGFYAEVFGFPLIAMTDDYALLTYPNDAFCLSFRKVDESHVTGLKLLFMTTDIDGVDTHLANTGLVDDRAIRMGSDVQRVIHFSAPSGLAIEIWEMPADE